MCGVHTSEKRLLAVSIFHSLQNSEWLDVAEKLTILEEREFNQLMRAFQLYRETKKAEQEKSNIIPLRKKLRTGENKK